MCSLLCEPPPCSPINLLSSTPFRVLYCFILSCWAADVLDDIMNSSLYSRSHDGIQDAFRFFGEKYQCSHLLCTNNLVQCHNVHT